MPLRSLGSSLPTHLNSYNSNIIEELYKPCLRNSSKYYRGVGYFRSGVFRLMTKDLIEFCLRGGKIRILTSTDMDPKDFRSAKEGYSMKTFYRTLEEMLDEEEISTSTRLLCALIASGNLELKVAMLPRDGIYHDKVGFFEDEMGSVVSFHGSANETSPALSKGQNVESVNVIWDWHDCYGVHGREWEDGLRKAFHSKEYCGAELLEISKLDQKFIKRHKISTNPADYKIILDQNFESHGDEADILPEMWDHQSTALEKWKRNGRRGILEHATGSGKTISSLWATSFQLERKGDVVVLVPSRPLLRQWHEKLERYFPQATIGRLGDGHDDSNFLQMMRTTDENIRFILVSTIQSFDSQKRKHKLLKRACESDDSNILLIVDECHKLGSAGKAELCKITPNSTLGLSATPEVFGDPAGTNRVLGLFEGKESSIVHRYGIREALSDGHLCPYYYHFDTVNLTLSEQTEYDQLRERMRLAYAKFIRSEDPDDEESWKSLIYRSRRIIRGASGKISAMSSIIKDNYQAGQSWLIYCDTNQMMDRAVAEIRNLNMVEPRIYNSEMSQYDQEQTLVSFERGGGVLIAIKCLDEGVDIPSISHGIILSSTTNPREFIQRRGRMLRKHPSKKHSIIFDTFALPASEESEETGFVLSEILRARELCEDSINSEGNLRRIDRIISEYAISDSIQHETEVTENDQ